MSRESDTNSPCLINSSKELDWKLCILCQESTTKKGTLVRNLKTESYQKLLDAVEERANLQDGAYVDIQGYLKQMSNKTFIEKKPVWHRSCYSDATNAISIQQARDRLQYAVSTGMYAGKKCGHKRTLPEMDETASTSSSSPFTRSATEPLRKYYCFFCQKIDDQDLFTLQTENAGMALQQAVEISQNQVLMTRLNNAITPSDAHTIDVQYHKACWTRHVFHALRDDACNQVKSPQTPLPMQIPCLIELINLVDVHTQNKAYLSMDVIETTYISMLGGRDEAQKHTPTLTRQWLKNKILSELPTVKSVRQKDRRKSSLLYCLEACEEDMVYSSLMQNVTCELEKTRMIYKTAKIVRNSITKFTGEKEENNEIIVSSTKDDVPTELYSLIRWILVGSEGELQTEVKNRTVDRSALTICQNIMYAFKTRRQVQHKHKKPSDTFRIPRSRENAQVLGLAFTIHHDTRNKMLMNLLHAQNYCISYNRTLLLETAIANAVVEKH